MKYRLVNTATTKEGPWAHRTHGPSLLRNYSFSQPLLDIISFK